MTFENWKKGRDSFGAPVHSNLMQRLGVSQLSVSTARNDWYVNEETPALESALAPLRGQFGRIHGIGFSMGGFAALRLSRALRPDRITLVSPQASVWPEEAPWSRWHPQGESDPDLRGLGRHGRTDQEGDLLYDPHHEEDRRQARLASSHMPRLTPVPLPFAGHPATSLIREAGRFNAVQRAALDPNGAARAIRAEHKAARRGSERYVAALDARRRAAASGGLS